MKKLLILSVFLKATLVSYAQWTAFSNGNLREISCGSATELIGISGTTTNNDIYKYNFNLLSWELYENANLTYYKKIAIASDGNSWVTGNLNGGDFIRKFRPGQIALTQASSISEIDIQSSTRAVASIGTGANNVLESDGSVNFTSFSGFGASAYRISIGEDGTLFALINPTLVTNNVYRYDGTTWINIPGNIYEISVGDANKVAGLSDGGIRHFLKDDQWVADLGAPFNTQKITVSSDGHVYLITNDATNNIYHNTWDAFACKPAPATNLTSTANLSICTGTSTVLTVSSSADVEWYDGATLLGNGLTYTTPILTSNKNYTVKTISGACFNTRNITVTVSAIPTLTLTTPAVNLEICSGSTTTLTATGTNLRWYDSETAVNYVGFNGSFTTEILSGNATFWVQAGSGGCLSPRTAVDVLVLTNPLPPTNVSNLGTVCPGPVTLTVESNFTVEWFATSTSTSVLGTGLSYTIPNAVNGSIVYAQAVNGSCRSTRVAFPISAFPGASNYSNPVNTTLAENLVVCNGGTTTLSATGQGIMHWGDAFLGGTILGTGNTFTTSAITSNTNIFYYAVDGNCSSNIQYVTVSTTASTNTTPIQNLSVCSGNTTTLSGVGTNDPVSWFEDATSLSPLFTGNSFVTPNLSSNTTYYLGHNHPSCVAERIPVSITVATTPNAPIINSSLTQQNVCVGSGAQVLMELSGTLSWFVDQIGGNSISNANPLVIGAIAAPTTLTYYAQANNGACFSPRTTVNVTAQMNPAAPTNSTSVQNSTICEGNSATLSVLNNNTIVWFDALSGGNQLATGSTFTTPILNTNQTYYVESQVLPAGCISATRTAISVNVNQIPDAPINAVGQSVICSGNTSILEATAIGNVSWYSDPLVPFALASGNSFTTPNLSTSRSYFAGVENNGCYSAKTEFAILVNPTYQTTLNEIACDSYIFDGQVINTSGTYTANLQSTLACDSIVTLNLIINNSSSLNMSESACNFFELNGQTYTSSGIYTQTLTNNVGCDSTITLNLTINQPNSATLTETGCLSYTLNGQTYTNNGTYIQNLTTVNGCDSTLTLNLTISTFATSTLNEIACSSFTLNGQVYNTNGVYTQTLTSAQGCDSIVTLNLTVNYPSSSTLTETACNSYQLNGQTYSQSGVYTQLISTVEGCDSTITLNLTINNSSSNILSETACNSYELNGQMYFQSGVYTQLISNVLGCDSTITLNLTINQASASMLTETACGTFTLNNEIFTQSGTYIQIIPNTANCDSTITLNLTMTPNSSNSLSETACDSFTWNTETYLQSGVYQQNFTNSLGCDSLVTLNLTINNSSVLILNETACGSFELNGQVYTNSGTYTQNLTNVNSCDSTITLNLTIGQPSSSILTETACGTFSLNGEIFTQSGTFTQIIPNSLNCDSTITLNLTITPNSSNSISETACDSFTWNSETYLETGVYQQTFTNSLGCDSIVTLNLTINNSVILNLTESVCESYTFNGETFSISGSYTFVLSTINGCDSTINLNLTINAIDNSVSQENEFLTANQSNATYQWIDCTNGNVAIDGETNQSFTASTNGEYSVQVTQNSCTETSPCIEVNTLNIKNLKADLMFSFYPNPSSDFIIVNTAKVNSILIITDISGKEIVREKLSSTNSTLNLEKLSNGIYNLSIVTENVQSANQKLVISKY